MNFAPLNVMDWWVLNNVKVIVMTSTLARRWNEVTVEGSDFHFSKQNITECTVYILREWLRINTFRHHLRVRCLGHRRERQREGHVISFLGNETIPTEFSMIYKRVKEVVRHSGVTTMGLCPDSVPYLCKIEQGWGLDCSVWWGQKVFEGWGWRKCVCWQYRKLDCRQLC